MEKKSAGAGRGHVNPSAVKPPRPAWADEAVQERKDAAARDKIKSMGYKKGGMVGSRKAGRGK